MLFTQEECRFFVSLVVRLKINCELNETFVRGLYYCFYLRTDVEKIHMILDMMKEIAQEPSSLFQGKLPMDGINFSHSCLVENLSGFIEITRYGLKNDYHEDACQLYLFEAYIYCKSEDDVMKIFLNYVYVPVNNQSSFRSCQIIYLYVASLNNQHQSLDVQTALQVLWSSIPDPHLTKIEFTQSFGEMDTLYTDRIVKAWEWYSGLVSRDTEIRERCPRSLKHLSRCAIREALKKSKHLHNVVEELDIPASLKSYLLLKKYGNEPSHQVVDHSPLDDAEDCVQVFMLLCSFTLLTLPLFNFNDFQCLLMSCFFLYYHSCFLNFQDSLVENRTELHFQNIVTTTNNFFCLIELVKLCVFNLVLLLPLHWSFAIRALWPDYNIIIPVYASHFLYIYEFKYEIVKCFRKSA